MTRHQVENVTLKVAGFFKEGEQIHKSNADCMKNLKTILDFKLSPSQTPSLQTAGQIKKYILQVTEVSGRAETKRRQSNPKACVVSADARQLHVTRVSGYYLWQVMGQGVHGRHPSPWPLRLFTNEGAC